MHLHDLIYAFTSAFFALFPVVNPISDGLIVNRYLINLDNKQKERIVRRIVLNCILVGGAAMILGHFILLVFNLSIPVVQFAGGVLICQVGLEGLSEAKNGGNRDHHLAEGEADFDVIKDKIFYPLSFPVCLGPGTISVIFSLMANSSSRFGKEGVFWDAINYGIIFLAILALCAMIYLCCIQGQKIIQRLGDSGSLIINKLVSFLTFCVGLQIIITGIASIFHIEVL